MAKLASLSPTHPTPTPHPRNSLCFTVDRVDFAEIIWKTRLFVNGDTICFVPICVSEWFIWPVSVMRNILCVPVENE